MREIRVDEETYAALAAEAERTGTTVDALADAMLIREAERRRFVGAAERLLGEWGPAFDERYPAPVRRAVA
jgi:hypothetical protein